MLQKEFHSYLAEISNLNTRQFRQLEEKIEAIKGQAQSSQILEKKIDEINCPHCGSNTVWRWGKRTQLQRYRCKNCRKTFNILTGTPLAHLHKKENWLTYANCLKSGVSIRKAAQQCNIHKNTSFRWRHRFLTNFNTLDNNELKGIIEGTEIAIPKSFKGSRNLKRKARKRGAKANTLPKHEIVYLLFSRDRHANTINTILPSFTPSKLSELLPNHISKDALFCSDNKTVYKIFTKTNHLRHGLINTKKGIFINKDIVHLQNVQHYLRAFQWWLLRFRGVATKYLTNYLAWYRILEQSHFKITKKGLLQKAVTSQINVFNPNEAHSQSP